MPIPHSPLLLIYSRLEIWQFRPPNLFFFCAIVLAVLGLQILNFACYCPQKMSCRDFDKDLIKSVDHFREKLHQFGEEYFNP